MTDRHDANDDQGAEASEPSSEGFEERQERRRRRLRSAYEDSRRPRFRHEPPPDPEEWEPQPWWKHSLQVLLETPAGLMLLILLIALVLWLLLPHLP